MAEGGLASVEGVSRSTGEGRWVCRGDGGRREGFCGGHSGQAGSSSSSPRTLPKKHLAAQGHHSQAILQQLLLKCSKGRTGKTPQRFAPGTVAALYSMALLTC